jgi:Uma2 family endonuclease
MNEIARFIPKPHATTQTAGGIPRLKWTLEDFEHLLQPGFFGGHGCPRERLELIDGDLVPMNGKGVHYERVRGKLTMYLDRALPADFDVYGEPGWRPGGDRDLEPEPEIIICKAASDPSTVPPTQVPVLIEVADSSLAYDTGVNAHLDATLGVQEYWVVDANRLTTRIRLDPSETDYTAITNHSATEPLPPRKLPSLTVRLADLGSD